MVTRIFTLRYLRLERVDRTIDISEENATKMTQRMAKEEGILAGMSSGGALYAALQIAEEIESGVYCLYYAC